MRIVVISFVLGLALSSCGGDEKKVVVVPQGSTVICPNGAVPTLSNGAYRC
jgi:hypothetical protein